MINNILNKKSVLIKYSLLFYMNSEQQRLPKCKAFDGGGGIINNLDLLHQMEVQRL